MSEKALGLKTVCLLRVRQEPSDVECVLPVSVKWVRFGNGASLAEPLP
jgi:hypothetical protein